MEWLSASKYFIMQLRGTWVSSKTCILTATLFFLFEAGLCNLYFPVKPNTVGVNCNVEACLLSKNRWLNYDLFSKKVLKRPQPREGCFLVSGSTFTNFGNGNSLHFFKITRPFFTLLLWNFHKNNKFVLSEGQDAWFISSMLSRW